MCSCEFELEMEILSNGYKTDGNFLGSHTFILSGVSE